MNDTNKPQMVTGFNHNIKHKGKIYHVQTEDSGSANPHIITHLFVGGNILATKKTSYADIVQADNLQKIVRELMQEQHKAMLRNLINGVYDEVLEADSPAVGATELPPLAPKPPPSPEAAAQVQVPAPPAAATQAEPPRDEARTVLLPAAQLPGAQVQSKQEASQAAPVEKQDEQEVASARTQPGFPAVQDGKFPPAESPSPRISQGVVAKPLAQSVPQATSPVPTPAVMQAVKAKPDEGGGFTEGKRPITKTRIHIPEQPQTETVPLMQRASARVTVRPKGTQPALPPEVVAAQEMSSKPKPKDTSGPTIFGEDLITEKSLDEVILGYLSGDGEDGG